MEKFYYDKKDIMEITGYKETKALEIIHDLNIKLEEMYKEKEEPIYIIKHHIPVWFFKKITGIERND